MRRCKNLKIVSVDSFAVWDTLRIEEQASLVLGLFVLSDEQRAAVLKEWGSREYEDTLHGVTTALADLQTLARDASMTDEQRESERLRLQEKIKWLSKS